MKIKRPEDYIYDFALFGRKGGYKPGLARMEYMLAQVGNPHRSFASIHIGGTNGKGSTAAFTDSILQEKDLKVGRFTSPHLSHYRERMMVNSIPIDNEELLALVNEMAPLIDGVEKLDGLGRPSFFEVTTFLAFTYFARQKIDIAVVEVGLGGLRDATNIIDPLVTGITNIGFEHTKQLGNTLAEIASQKAGIIKAEVPVVTGTVGVALEVIREEAKKKKAPLISLQEMYRWERHSKNLNGQTFSLSAPGTCYDDISIQMLGTHQLINASFAVALIENLPIQYQIREKDIRAGLAKTFWPGRLEIWQENPLIILDGAHNPSGFAALADFIEKEFPRKKVVFVLSFLKDKDILPFQAIIENLGKSVIFTQSDNFRAANPQSLYGQFVNLKLPKRLAPGVREALSMAKEDAGPEGIVCLTGSLYAVAEGREVLREGNCQ